MTSQVHDEDEEPSQPRMRSLQDLYDSTDEVHLVCLLADSENIAFEEAIRDTKWKAAMDEEIKAIDYDEVFAPVASHDQVADIFTKPLPTVLFENLKKMIGMKDRKSFEFKGGIC